MKLKLLLASLVIFLSQPMMAMSVSILEEVVKRSDWVRNFMLQEMRSKIEKDPTWVDCPDANGMTRLMLMANSAYDYSDVEKAYRSAKQEFNHDNELYALLLDAHANIYLRNNNQETALTIAAKNKHLVVCERIITHSHVARRYTLEQLKSAQHKTYNLLWCFWKICPQLTNDAKALILSIDSNIWQDACCTPLRLHGQRYASLHLMPIEIVREGIQAQAFELDKALSALKHYKLSKLKPLMLETAQALQKSDSVMLERLNPDMLEQKYGKKIDAVIAQWLETPQDKS